jgi:hypothetical protein
MNLPCSDRFAALHYVLWNGAIDAWCVSGEVTPQLRGIFEPNERVHFKDMLDGSSRTIAIGEADTGTSICHGPGCHDAIEGRMAQQAWLSGAAGYDFLVGQGFVVGSGYASTAATPFEQCTSLNAQGRV